jgi:glucosyl-3-phosphoglycerate synthase
MPNFSQQSTDVTTFHILKKDDVHLASKLQSRAERHKAMLVLPCLASEFSNPDSLPVFQNILNQLSEIDYVDRIVFGLDNASQDEARLLHSLLKEHGVRNGLVQWNDGPAFRPIFDELLQAGLNVSIPGKGRNMFMSFGLCLALGADSVALVDADIKTFRKNQVDRLFFPVMALDYDFVKGYYSRIHDNHFYGRVKRLLVDPLLLALKRRFAHSREEKFNRIIDFLLSFQYQLSGEVAYRADLLKKMRFAMNWGVEIYSLIEVYRKASSICQVQFSASPFDHKHQSTGPEGGKRSGLHQMAVDIIASLINFLIVEEGLELTPTFFRDLSVTYQALAEGMIKKYAHDSAFNNLEYDRDGEEVLVRQFFRTALVSTGEMLGSTSRLSELFLFFVKSHPEFAEFLENGLGDSIVDVADKGEHSLFEIPHTPSWERAEDKLPHIFDTLRAAARSSAANFSH